MKSGDNFNGDKIFRMPCETLSEYHDRMKVEKDWYRNRGESDRTREVILLAERALKRARSEGISDIEILEVLRGGSNEDSTLADFIEEWLLKRG